MRPKQYNKSIKFLLPKKIIERLHLIIASNPPSFDFERDTCFGIFWDMLNQFHDVDEDGMVPLHSKILEQKYSNYKDHLGWLIMNDLIERDNQYIKGEKSRRYRFKMGDLLELGMGEVSVNTKSTVGRYIIKKHNQNQSKSKNNEQQIREMRKHLLALKFDHEAANQYLRDRGAEFNQTEKLAAEIAIYKIQNIKDKHLVFKRSKTNGRIDTNLTSLPTYLKQFIISFEEGVQIDLKCSQPTIFNIILNTILSSITYSTTFPYLLSLCSESKPLISSITLIRKEFETQRKLVGLLCQEAALFKLKTEAGLWYEYMADIFNSYHQINLCTRNHAKQLWMTVAYSHNNSNLYREDKKPFCKSLPAIFKLIQLIKRRDHADFAILLQSIESFLFIDLIAAELVANNIVFYTQHDSVMVDRKDLDLTLDIMNKILNDKLGFKPQFDIKPLREITERKPRKNKINISMTEQLVLFKQAA